jgi:hypothetical protein
VYQEVGLKAASRELTWQSERIPLESDKRAGNQHTAEVVQAVHLADGSEMSPHIEPHDVERIAAGKILSYDG